MKQEVAELRVQAETSRQARTLQENELQSARSEVKTGSASKQWYQEQLRLAQESNTELQVRNASATVPVPSLP